MKSIILFTFKTASALPLGTIQKGIAQPADLGNTPIEQSTQVWASVISNVAPWMALVGERNAKELMRITSSHDQLLLMAAAPLGIFSILTSAIRLSGFRILRRMVGRESERTCEALVELTPLSVSPASSVYTPHAVEIEPSEQRDQVPYVCAHTRQTTRRVLSVLQGFGQLSSSWRAKKEDQDSEIVLAIKGNTLSAEATADLVMYLADGQSELPDSLTSGVTSASLSFRTTGISPNQTVANDKKLTVPSQCRNVFIASFFLMLMCGLQLLGYLRDGGSIYSNSNLQTFSMTLAGYIGMTVFTIALLISIKKEVTIERLQLPAIFSTAVWTFSDYRHTGHRSFDIPQGQSLVQASPTIFSPAEKIRRKIQNLILCLGLVVSYIVYYLGIRVACWWVPLGSLLITWLSAGVRAIIMKNFLVANGKPLEEHWLGIFQNDVYHSLLATVDMMLVTRERPGASLLDGDGDVAKFAQDAIELSPSTGPASCTLVVAKPYRQSLQTWSGCEDVMKVSLEMSKQCCRSHKFMSVGHRLSSSNMPSSKRIIRFKLMIYVPGLIWKADSPLDFILTEDFDFPNPYRDLLKIFHLCDGVRGQITRHTPSPTAETEISHVLCGPVTLPPAGLTGTITLTDLLVQLREVNTECTKAYTLEQAILLPTIQLAAMFESFHSESATASIQVLQDSHTDNLKLSGADFLPNLQQQFSDLNVWENFMLPKSTVLPQELKPRDNSSGLYGRKVVHSSSNTKTRNMLEAMEPHLQRELHGPWRGA